MLVGLNMTVVHRLSVRVVAISESVSRANLLGLISLSR